MVNSSSRTVLHEYKATFLWWLIPLFLIVGCTLVAANIWLPVMLRPPSDPGLGISIGLAILAGLAVPVGAVLMYLLIPRITTTLDPQRRVVTMEYRRPIGLSVKEYPAGDIADIKPVYVRNRSYALAMVLKSGQNIRLEYRLMPNAERLQQQAGKIKAQLAPYLSQ